MTDQTYLFDMITKSIDTHGVDAFDDDEKRKLITTYQQAGQYLPVDLQEFGTMQLLEACATDDVPEALVDWVVEQIQLVDVYDDIDDLFQAFVECNGRHPVASAGGIEGAIAEVLNAGTH